MKVNKTLQMPQNPQNNTPIKTPHNTNKKCYSEPKHKSLKAKKNKKQRVQTFSLKYKI